MQGGGLSSVLSKMAIMRGWSRQAINFRKLFNLLFLRILT